MSGQGFIKFMRSDTAEELMRYPASFTLLAQIALRARREVPKINPYKMQVGEAMVGDYAAIGLTRQQFRTALEHLIEWGMVTTRITNKGTVAMLCSTDVYDINGISVQPSNQPADQPASNQQTNQPATTNKNERRKKKEGKNYSLRSESAEEDEPDYFAAFWLAYPRKVSKTAASKSFSQLTLEEKKAAPQWALDWFSTRPLADWFGANGTDYRPHPTSWINQKRWTDLNELTIITPSPNGTQQPKTTSTRSTTGAVFVNDDLRRASIDLLAGIEWPK